MMGTTLRILVIDDTALYRKILKDVLKNIPNTEVVDTAPNGKIGLRKIEQLKPDLVTLDVEMPEMDGLETLKNLRTKAFHPAVIMVSSLTRKDADVTLKALQLGAFDFIAKPDKGSIQQNIIELTEQFKPKIEALLIKKGLAAALAREPKPVVKEKPLPQKPLSAALRTAIKPRVVALGISTGGPKALAQVIPQLPGDFPVPLVLVQHMPPVFTKALADSLNKKSQVTVVEATSGMHLQASHVYIAPGGKQMRVVPDGGNGKIEITDDPPENHCKPSADYLFRSVKNVFGAKTLAVIMTGMGRDGTEGLKILKKDGAYVIAQDEQSCVVFGMPMEAIKAGVVDEVLPLDKIAEKIVRIVKGY